MTWLEEIMLTHQELESPASFWKWAALSAISATVKDNVWWDKWEYKLFPNIYVLLHAPSGLRKGPPIAMAKRFVQKVNNTRIISGRSSIQGILKDMGTAKSQPGGMITTSSSVFICSSELTSSIVEDPVAMTILTDLYDRHYNEGEWKSLLKLESFSLRNPTVTMLAGSNEAHTENFFEKKDVEGGYIARTFIIRATERQRVNSLMFKLKNPPNDEKSSEYLKKLAGLKGEFIVSDGIRKYFDEWYHELIRSFDATGAQDSTGTLNRFDDSVLKVAMLISLGSSPDLVMSREAIEEAISECEKLVGNVRRATLSKGKGQWTSHKALVIEQLLKREGHQMSKKYLNKTYWSWANSGEWDEIMNSLEAGGIIRIESMGNELLYVMPESVANQWKQHLEGK